NGSVRAERVTIAGELTGNIETAAHVEVMQSGALTGDVKSTTFSVAKGSRIRGQGEFGGDDGKGGSSDKYKSNGHVSGNGQKQCPLRTRVRGAPRALARIAARRSWRARRF